MRPSGPARSTMPGIRELGPATSRSAKPGRFRRSPACAAGETAGFGPVTAVGCGVPTAAAGVATVGGFCVAPPGETGGAGCGVLPGVVAGVGVGAVRLCPGGWRGCGARCGGRGRSRICALVITDMRRLLLRGGSPYFAYAVAAGFTLALGRLHGRLRRTLGAFSSLHENLLSLAGYPVTRLRKSRAPNAIIVFAAAFPSQARRAGSANTQSHACQRQGRGVPAIHRPESARTRLLTADPVSSRTPFICRLSAFDSPRVLRVSPAVSGTGAGLAAVSSAARAISRVLPYSTCRCALASRSWRRARPGLHHLLAEVLREPLPAPRVGVRCDLEALGHHHRLRRRRRFAAESLTDVPRGTRNLSLYVIASRVDALASRVDALAG